jgi:hypothetical protein
MNGGHGLLVGPVVALANLLALRDKDAVMAELGERRRKKKKKKSISIRDAPAVGTDTAVDNANVLRQHGHLVEGLVVHQSRGELLLGGNNHAVRGPDANGGAARRNGIERVFDLDQLARRTSILDG